MTREEAIACLKKNKKWQFVDSDILDEALDMAISALSQPQGDLISRSEAIDVTKWFFYPEMIAEQLKQLPSAQPDIEAIRQEIETKMNFCRAKDTISYGLRGTVLKEVLDIIDKHISRK